MKRLSLFFIFTIVYLVGYSQASNIDNPNGYNIFYYPSGQISSEGNMVDGVPVGIWKAYYVDGTLKSIGKRRNAQLDSVWNFYNQYGNIQKKINYQFGKKNGYFYTFEYFKNADDTTVGYLSKQELFLNNKRNGVSEYYYRDGSIEKAINYVDGKRDGTCRIYDKSGSIITIIEYRNGREVDRENINQYSDSLKVGIWKEFYPNGKIKTEKTYQLGVLHGLVKEYDLSGTLIKANRFENGELKDTSITIESSISIVEQFYDIRDENGELILKKSGGFIDDKPIGVHRTFDSLGRVNSSITYDKNGNIIGKGIVNIEGDRLGDWVFYYSSGTIKSKGMYNNNRRVGPWTYYYSTESVEQTGIFKRGLPNGQWTYYFENGKIKRIEEYYLGKEQGESIEYDHDGNIIAQGKYNEGLKEGVWFYDFYFHTQKGAYKNGLKEGLWNYYYKNGNQYFSGNYIQDSPHGVHVYYYKNTKKKSVRYYSYGRKVKNWEFYDYYGTLLKILTFDNDKLIKIDGVSVDY